MSDFYDDQYESDLRTIQLLGRDVVYARGENRITVKVIRGSTTFQLYDDANGVFTSYESVDFIMQAELLAIEGDDGTTVIEPQRGDRIFKQHSDSLTLTYELLDERRIPCFAYADETRRIVRVHTRLVEE